MPSFTVKLAILCLLAGQGVAQSVTPPSDFFGFEPGTERKLLPWESLEAYYRLVCEESPQASFHVAGRTGEGRNIVLLAIGDAGRRDRNQILERQRGLSLGTLPIEDLPATLQNHPAVVYIQATLHSTEIGASLTLPVLVHQILTGQSQRMRRIREQVLIVLVPSANPDGQDLVCRWYDETLDTPYEGTSPPTLYQPYAGHDNNRDWFMLSLLETRVLSRVLYEEWYPQVVLDIHQMGGGGPRMFIPPYADPVNPNLPSLLLRHLDFFGGAMAMELTRAGLPGIVHGTTFDNWWHGGARSVPCRHNMIGILTETASARLASPRFVDPERVAGLGDGLPESQRRSNYPDPYQGGTWTIGDVVRYQMVSTLAVLDHAARFRESLLMDQLAMARESIRLGSTAAPFAFWLPRDQRDPAALKRLVANLRRTGIEAYEAEEEFHAGAEHIPQGSLVIPLAQPFRAHVKDLMEIQEYPVLRRGRDGPLVRPYDAAGWTLPVQFGLTCHALNEPIPGEAVLVPVTGEEPLPAAIPPDASNGIALDLDSTAAFSLVHAALRRGLHPRWEVSASRGAVVFEAADRAALADLAGGTGLRLRPALDDAPPSDGLVYRAPRVAILQPFPESMDGGWTRLVLEEHGFAVDILHPPDLHRQVALASFDALILPSTSPASLRRGAGSRLPKPYSEGLGATGMRHLRAWADAGGRVIAFDQSIPLLIDLAWPAAENPGEPGGDGDPAPAPPRHVELTTVRGATLPGSLLQADLDVGKGGWTRGLPSPFGYFAGAPRVLSLGTSPEGPVAIHASTIQHGDPLISGYLDRSELMQGRPILASFPLGSGRGIAFAFRPQHRSQTLGTLPLLFRALVPDPVATR